jgi:hypothetical protein
MLAADSPRGGVREEPNDRSAGWPLRVRFALFGLAGILRIGGLTVEFGDCPGAGRKNKPGQQNDEKLRSPSPLPGLVRWNYLAHDFLLLTPAGR